MREENRRVGGWRVGAVVVLLFAMWSLSFVSIEALLAPSASSPRFDWLSLTVARFVPAGLLCGLYCLLVEPHASLAIVRRYWRRLTLSGLLIVPGYNFALYSGQQHQIPAPIASFVTALLPLYVLVLSAIFLHERISPRAGIGFAISLGGLFIVALSRDGGASYSGWVLVTAMAPLCWSIHTVLTKPVTGTVSPLLWSFLATIFGSAMLLPVLPFSGPGELTTLDAAGFAWLAHLVLLCTVLGFALWAWLLAHMPATSVGFTVFLNPPMTSGYKLALSLLFPAAFSFQVGGAELLGGLLMMTGVALAVIKPFRRSE